MTTPTQPTPAEISAANRIDETVCSYFVDWPDKDSILGIAAIIHRELEPERAELVEWGEHTARHNRVKRRLPIKPKTFCRCGKQARARGLCTKHYQRLMKEKRGKWL